MRRASTSRGRALPSRATARTICRRIGRAIGASKSCTEGAGETMLAFLRNRAVLIAIGLLLLALLVWFAGPYIAFADHKPLQGVVARLVTILVMVVAYAAFVQLRQARH